jgi:L-ascorbate metabolism protein UlaG (beta-lactamase superfamily)
VGLLGLSVLALGLVTREARGARAAGERLERMRRSPAWSGDRFTNALPRVDGPWQRMLGEWLVGGSADRVPTAPIPVVARGRGDFDVPPPSGLAVTWLGHSTLLLEVDGARVLVDPVWGERASPVSFAGPRRWFAPPLALDALPDVDAVVISHDHYDHLDVPTVKALAARGVRWFVPLGIGAHLEAWGVAPGDVVELDWWASAPAGPITITAVPARHFSGRGVDDQNATLWCGFALVGPTHRVFYSGDTAMHPGFAEIGARLGPFDLTLIESGAYDALWSDVHLGPEQAVIAHHLARGRVLLPVHWGLFDLALHGWTEPIERVLVAAARARVPVLTPRPGERVEPSAPPAFARWWPDLRWRTEVEAPAWSTHVEALLAENALERIAARTSSLAARPSSPRAETAARAAAPGGP